MNLLHLSVLLADMARGARLGQHFLNAHWVARDLVDSLNIERGERVVEIGPGKGALTQELLARGAIVIAIEKDPDLVAYLRSTYAGEIASGALSIIEADIRSISPEKIGLKHQEYVLAANIPYYITGEIIRQFLEASAQPHSLALLIQKEVAQRIVARDGKESILSLSVKAYGEPSIVATVPAGCFNPPPTVDSAILLVKNISKSFFEHIQERSFFDIVRTGFSAKRKMLAGNLTKKYGAGARDALTSCAIEETIRAEDVPLEKWECLARKL
jgi:16S rRNA (adenine1518-N6/adenine1519-N6)-dimethyltransferase